jgi:hypothetical protein
MAADRMGWTGCSGPMVIDRGARRSPAGPAWPRNRRTNRLSGSAGPTFGAAVAHGPERCRETVPTALPGRSGPAARLQTEPRVDAQVTGTRVGEPGNTGHTVGPYDAKRAPWRNASAAVGNPEPRTPTTPGSGECGWSGVRRRCCRVIGRAGMSSRRNGPGGACCFARSQCSRHDAGTDRTSPQKIGKAPLAHAPESSPS